MESFTDWWAGLQLLLKVFYTIGFVSTAIVGFQTILTLFGLDAHEAPDMDFEVDDAGEAAHDDGGVSFISVRGVTAFLVGFGWVGAICVKAGLALLAVFPIAIGVGLAMMVLIYFLMKILWSMRASGTLDYHNAIGQVGSVYLPIPPNREGNGQIEVMIQDRLQVLQAQTSAGERIENRAKVLVIDVMEDNTLIVRPEN